MNINTILQEITTPKSVYDEIMDNILCPRFCNLKSELISEIAISYLERPKKVEKIWKAGYGKYYFIRTVINNVRSNTSPFYKNCIKTDYDLFMEYPTIVDDSDDVINLHLEREIKINTIVDEYKKMEKSWFESTLWEEYYVKGKTYRKIEQEWGIDHCLVWHTINNMKSKLKNSIKQKKQK